MKSRFVPPFPLQFGAITKARFKARPVGAKMQSGLSTDDNATLMMKMMHEKAKTFSALRAAGMSPSAKDFDDNELIGGWDLGDGLPQLPLATRPHAIDTRVPEVTTTYRMESRPFDPYDHNAFSFTEWEGGIKFTQPSDKSGTFNRTHSAYHTLHVEAV